MSTRTCRDGHPSTTDDFCSECGLEMDASSAFAHDPTPIPQNLCPVCSTDRDDPRSPFCGVCGYNFITRVGGDVVAPTTPVAAAPVVAAPVHHAPAANPKSPHIEIEISFDATNAAAPKDQPIRKFSLYDEESLLGRRSRGTPQTVGLDGDDFISRRHVLIIRVKSGYVVRLFDNTNGGTHNGKDLVAGVEVPLALDDKIGIGSFTVIRVTAIK